MRNICISIILLLALGCQGFSQPADHSLKSSQPKVLIYFFHGTHRCTGCINAEKAAVTVLNELYKSQQEKGIIKFQSINIEESQNKALAEKYEIAWNSLLIIPANNEQGKVDLTEQAFAFGTNPAGLKPYIQKVIDPILK